MLRKRFGSHHSAVLTILLDETKNYLFAGDQGGHIVQYSLLAETKVVKHFGNVGIGWIRASAKFGNLAVFGGNQSQILILNISQRTILSKLRVAIGWIYSLQFCEIPSLQNGIQILLAISGSKPDYSNFKTDLLNFTSMVQG